MAGWAGSGRCRAPMRVTKTDAPARPRIGVASSTVTLNAPSGSAIARSRRVAERRTGRVRVLAGDAADRERVAAVGRDVDLDRGVGQPEQLDRVRADGASSRPSSARRRMPSCSSPMPSSRARGDHAVGGVTVGLARGDRERAGQHGARQRDDDLVAGGEVVRAADDAARLGLADIHLAPVDRLAVALRLGHEPSTWPTTIGPVNSKPWVSSSSKPTFTSAACRCSRVTSSGRSTHSPSQQIGTRIRPPSRTAARSAHRPRPCRACRSCRCGTAGCARCPCRTRSPGRPRDRCRRSAARCG